MPLRIFFLYSEFTESDTCDLGIFLILEICAAVSKFGLLARNMIISVSAAVRENFFIIFFLYAEYSFSNKRR